MINQVPNLDELTELEFIYYSVGILYIQEIKTSNKKDLIEHLMKESSEVIKTFLYELADLKTMLLDLDSVARGIAGAKKPFDINSLPTMKRERTISGEPEKKETEEERAKRHEKFFKELKDSFKRNP